MVYAGRARPHTINDCLGFPQEKFHNRVVSNHLEFFLPATSPDLTPLGFFFCGIAEKFVYDAKPRSLEQLKKFVRVMCKECFKRHSDQCSGKLHKKSQLMHGK